MACLYFHGFMIDICGVFVISWLYVRYVWCVCNFVVILFGSCDMFVVLRLYCLTFVTCLQYHGYMFDMCDIMFVVSMWVFVSVLFFLELCLVVKTG